KVTRIGSNRVRTNDPERTVRIYDLSDLFAVAPGYPARYPRGLGTTSGLVFGGDGGAGSGEMTGATGFGGAGGFGGGGGGFFQIQGDGRPEAVPQGIRGNVLRQFGQSGSVGAMDHPARISVESLVTAITEVISPDSWKENGGFSTMTTLGTALLVSADEATHSQIESLLGLFRQKWGTLRTVSVNAWWLWLTEAELAGLLGQDDPEAEPAKVDGKPVFGLVQDMAAWQQKIQGKVAEGAAATEQGYRAAVTCYNGQTVHTLSGDQRSVVTQVQPLITRDETGQPVGSVAYLPTLTVIQEGAALEVTPLVTISGKIVILDLHSRVSRLQEEPAAAAPAAEEEAPGKDSPVLSPQLVLQALNRQPLAVQRLSTTLRAPADRVMLAGGMTFNRQEQAGGRSLYLFVKADVQELRSDDDQPEAREGMEGGALPRPQLEDAVEEAAPAEDEAKP
ncbi:MAG: hypothetical protein KDA79_19100, partial [Planctomycetaceae bacterium]|nr:hypothetical protein [Planctomycetaceae bacterium]